MFQWIQLSIVALLITETSNQSKSEQIKSNFSFDEKRILETAPTLPCYFKS